MWWPRDTSSPPCGPNMLCDDDQDTSTSSSSPPVCGTSSAGISTCSASSTALEPTELRARAFPARLSLDSKVSGVCYVTGVREK